MSEELRPCPFCGGTKICTEKGINLNYCDNCSAESNVEHWNNRPIEDALNARIAELRGVISDYRNDASRVLDEKCPSDERHCGCVPILRDQLNKYQKALILITTMPGLSQATIAREALQERGKFIWTEQSVGEYWVTKLDILQDKFDTLEKDYADVCQKRLEAADVFSRQIIELESENAELKADLKNKNACIAALQAENAALKEYRDGHDPKVDFPPEGIWVNMRIRNDQMLTMQYDHSMGWYYKWQSHWFLDDPDLVRWYPIPPLPEPPEVK